MPDDSRDRLVKTVLGIKKCKRIYFLYRVRKGSPKYHSFVSGLEPLE